MPNYQWTQTGKKNPKNSPQNPGLGFRVQSKRRKKPQVGKPPVPLKSREPRDFQSRYLLYRQSSTITGTLFEEGLV